MKRIISLLFLLLCFNIPLLSQSDNVDATLEFESFYIDTLTSAIDTITVEFTYDNSSRYNAYTITAKSSAADTLEVWTLGLDGVSWTQVGSVDLADNTDETTLNVGTTQHEFLVLDPQPKKIRIIGQSHDDSTCRIVISGKKVP